MLYAVFNTKTRTHRCVWNCINRKSKYTICIEPWPYRPMSLLEIRSLFCVHFRIEFAADHKTGAAAEICRAGHEAIFHGSRRMRPDTCVWSCKQMPRAMTGFLTCHTNARRPTPVVSAPSVPPARHSRGQRAWTRYRSNERRSLARVSQLSLFNGVNFVARVPS